MTDKRIKDLPLTTSPTDDDAIPLDNATDGARGVAMRTVLAGVSRAILISSTTQYQVVHAKGTGAADTVPRVEPALANTSVVTTEPLYLALDGGTGGNTIRLARQMIVEGVTVAGSPANDTAIYVTNTGTISTSPGTNSRRVGKILRVTGLTCTVHFDGIAGGGGGGGGGVSSVTASAPIASSGGANPNITATVGTTTGTLAAGDDSRFPSATQKNALAGTDGTPDTGNPYVTKQGRTLQKTYDGSGGTPTIATANASGTPTVDATSGSGSLLSAFLIKTAGIVALMLWDTAGGLISKIKGAPSTTTGTTAGTVAIESGDGDGSHNAGDLLIDIGVNGGGGPGRIKVGSTRDADIVVGRSNANVSTKFKQPLLVGDGGGSGYAAIVNFDKVTSGEPGPLSSSVSVYGKARADGVTTAVLQRSSGGVEEIETKKRVVRAVSSNATIAADDDIIHVDTTSGAVALTAAALDGRKRTIKKVAGANTITVVRTASEKIEGTAATYTLPGSALTPSLTQPLAWVLYDDGTDRFVL